MSNVNIPAPDPPSINKNWHPEVNNDLRLLLVSKLFNTILPSSDRAALSEQNINDLVQYCRKVEKELFEEADDREEYYHLCAEKIYKMQKETKEKEQQRLAQSTGQSA